MVGEIRDSETAQIAVRAALTGHLVLSTLHTNDAPSTVSRLLDVGIEPFLVPPPCALWPRSASSARSVLPAKCSARPRRQKATRCASKTRVSRTARAAKAAGAQATGAARHSWRS